MWRAIGSVFGGGDDARARQRQRRATLEGANPDWFDIHALPFVAPPPASADSLSLTSNPSVSSYNSSTRRRNHKHIAMQYFGPSSQTLFDAEDEHDTRVSPVEASTGSSYLEQSIGDEHGGADANDANDPTDPFSLDMRTVVREETASQRHERKENERAFENLVHLANTKQPVTLNAFKRNPPSQGHTTARDGLQSARRERDELEAPPERPIPGTRQLNTELIEAYVAYARSIGREPEIEVAIGEPQSDDEEEELATERLSFVHERGRVDDKEHWGTQWIGTRFSKRRGCVQFWAFLGMGVVVTVVMIIFLAQVRLNEVLHLDAFVDENVVVTEDFAFMHLRDEVGFRLRYEIDAGGRDIQVLLLSEDNFEQFVAGDAFSVVAQGSQMRTPYASLPLTRIDNDDHDEMYLVVQPCELTRTNVTLDVCGNHNDTSADAIRRLPRPFVSKEKLFALRKAATATIDTPATLTLRSFYVNPMPDTCSASGWRGAPYLLIFVPYVLAALFGLRVFQMLAHCESFRSNLERNYKNEFAVPESEVDYWQPSPWDRKVPKTRLLGPCCWQKMRRPLEPFYTWWRHENYFTWVFFPYRNERLSRSERAIIIFCSLYITFYVTFVLTMFHNALGDRLPTPIALVAYYLLLMVLPSLGKAIFKEIFKLIFRQRRKFFRLKATGGDTSGFSFRFAFLMQVLVVVFITLAQGPMIYIWLYRSCTFLSEFMYFGVLAAFARLSLVGLSMDFLWYSVIATCGWSDLCPHCTERLASCDCFNDELLVLAVERVGAKWALILLLDDVLSRHAGHEPQFAQYTAEQLRARWHTLVDRATVHVETVEKLYAYRLKNKRDALRRRHKSRLSLLVERASFRSRAGARGAPFSQPLQGDNDDAALDETADLLSDVDSIRERKILALDHKIREGSFPKHHDATIAAIFQSMQHAVQNQQTSTTTNPNANANANGEATTTRTAHAESSMRVKFTTPAQRLARREDERERRERAFSVLSGYRIEKRQAPEAPIGLETETESPPRKPVSGFGRWWWSSLGGAALENARELLVPSRAHDVSVPAAAETVANDRDVVVVVCEEDPPLATIQEGDDDRDSPSSSDARHVAAAARAHAPQPLQASDGAPGSGEQATHTYEVSARESTLWDATVGRATAFVGWVFKYDSTQY